MSSYNKFAKSNVSKLGFEIARSGGLTQVMAQGAINAIPIWEMQYPFGRCYPSICKKRGSHHGTG